MKNLLLLIGCSQAIIIHNPDQDISLLESEAEHPDVPKSYVPPDFTPDQKGWADIYTGPEEGNDRPYHEYDRVIPEHF